MRLPIPSNMKNSSKIKIFLVDDDIMFIESLKRLLIDKRAVIKTFSCGEECLKNLKEYPQIIVLDYALNNSLNGVQVLNRIKQYSPDTKVIMLSGNTKSGIKADTLKYGAYDFIEKSEDGMLDVQKEVKQMYDEIESNDNFDREKREMWWINGGILVLIFLMYLINHLKK
jgi:two-component system OmpR family response regulator